MKSNSIFSIAFLLILIFGCSKEGPEGKNSLIFFEPEPIGENCPTGGYKVITGLDLNDNNFLETTEIENTEYICNGGSSIIRLEQVPVSANCSSGGYKIMSGIDTNNNNTLEDSEIQNTNFICNGNNSLVDIETENPGTNCTSGGYKIMSGIDINNNNELDDAEIQNTEYICNGNDGSSDKVIRLAIATNAGTTSTTGRKVIGIYGFNKDDYPGVDSIVFSGTPYSVRSANRCSIELYDFTSDKVIKDSRIFSNKDSEEAEIKFTGNLIDNIDSGYRNLGILIKSEIENIPAGMKGTCYLYLYRK